MKSDSIDFESGFYHILQHRNTPTRLSRLFCITKVPLLHSKRTTIGRQMKSYCIAKGAFLSFTILHNNTHKQHNTLYTSIITAARSKFKNFELKISLCAQLAVLSNKNANIVQERSFG